MSHVVVIGCGVVGAAIAYELSQVPGLKITVLDKQPPAQGATGAALGVLMGVISHKIKGRAWRMRQASLQRYEILIPELEALTGRQIPFNRQGLMLVIPSQESRNIEEDMAAWEKLVEVRHSQGWQLEIWDAAHAKANCPQLDCEQIQSVVYSPQDRQIEPVALTLALIDAAQRQGVDFHFGVTVEGYDLDTTTNEQRCQKVYASSSSTFLAPVAVRRLSHNVDWLVVAAGLGSFNICQQFNLAPQMDIKPVLGQALHLQLERPIGNPNFQPVITGNDVHIVPVGKGEYWVGATVEFPANEAELVPDSARLNIVMQQAIAFCPSLAEATVVKTWSGLRPRPEGRPAPIIGQLPGYSNVLLATGHYRNGVLLAPATAEAIREIIFPCQDASAKRSRRR